MDGWNWLIPLSFGTGMVFGAILLVLAATIYVAAEEDRRAAPPRGGRSRPWGR